MNENKNNNNNKECNCNPDQIVFAFNLDTVSTSFIIIISLFPLLACIYVQYSCSLGLPNCFSNQKVHRVPWKRQHTHRHTSRTLILKYVSFRFYAFCCFHFHFDTELSPLSLSLSVHPCLLGWPLIRFCFLVALTGNTMNVKAGALAISVALSKTNKQ